MTSRKQRRSTACEVEMLADDAVSPPALDRRVLSRLLSAALGDSGRMGPCRLTVRFIDDATAANLHWIHFKDPSTTDVMTFPDGSADPADGALLLGDLAVCVAVAEREAQRRGRPVADELTLYILHGMLHLLGHDDRDAANASRMWAVQKRLLAVEGISLEEQPS